MNASDATPDSTSDLNVETSMIAHLRGLLAEQGYLNNDLADLRSLAIRAANAAFRRIQPKARRVETPSPSFGISPELQQGVTLLFKAVEYGLDLTPFQSKLRLTDPDFHDHLLTDWGIHHFHLGASMDANDSRFIARTGPVLYAFVTDENFFAIGIDLHGKWADPQLLETLHKNWPKALGALRVEGQIMQPLATESEIKEFRRTGINGFVQLSDGTVYRSASVGRTTDGTPIRAVLSANNLIASVRQVQKQLDMKLSDMRAKVSEKRKIDPASLSFEVAIVREGADRSAGFWLDEITTGYCFHLQGPPR